MASLSSYGFLFMGQLSPADFDIMSVRPRLYTRYRRKKAGSLPREMPTPNSHDPLAGPRAEHRRLPRFLSDTSRSCTGSNRPSSQLEHVARLPEDTPTPAHQALRCHIDLSLGRLPDPSWRRCPGRPRDRWLDLQGQQ